MRSTPQLTVAIAHDAQFPVKGYGGTERAIWWLAKGLSELGIRVKLVCRPGSECPFAEVVPADFSRSIEPQAGQDVDVTHYFFTPEHLPVRPYMVTIEGNGKRGETFPVNTAFVSRNHASRHGAECFVYNGIDPDEYRFSEEKDDYLIFLAKASWRVKNVKGAIRLARRTRRTLRILGGDKPWPLKRFWRARGIHWEGMLGGEKKTGIVSRARGLLFPVVWHEPFGIAVVEALVSGTPVLASPHGSLPELVGAGVGKICRSEAEFLDAIPELSAMRPSDCRDWAVEHFHYRKTAASYLRLYEKLLKGESLNRAVPYVSEAQGKVCPIPRRIS